jgi:hypothetical protein
MESPFNVYSSSYYSACIVSIHIYQSVKFYLAQCLNTLFAGGGRMTIPLSLSHVRVHTHKFQFYGRKLSTLTTGCCDHVRKLYFDSTERRLY